MRRKFLRYGLCLGACLLATPALAEEYMPPCGVELERGWWTFQIDKRANGFVSYVSIDTFENPTPEDARLRTSLEHCASGQTLWVDTGPYEEHGPNTVHDHFEAQMKSSQGITQDQLAKELRALGARTRIVSSSAESCACQAFYPQARGDKTPYVSTE